MNSEEQYYFDGELGSVDTEISNLIALEEERQQRKIILIASESMSPMPVRQALGSVFTNIYAEGYPSTRMEMDNIERLKDNKHQFSYLRRYSDRRYYKGTEFADMVEALAQKRVAALFGTENVSANNIHVNVQALSGAPANNAVFTAFLRPGDTVLSMALNCGGHLSHGSEVNRSGLLYNIVPYGLQKGQNRLNYDNIRTLALKHRPKLIIGGYSAYPWDIDWKTLREIADEIGNGCLLLADVSHISAFIVAGILNNPIEHAHVVMFTTHKAIAGPRGAVLLSTNAENAERIDRAVFPGEQGGPHLNNIVAQAVCFKIASGEKFKEYSRKVVENAKYFAECCEKLGLKVAYGGTETHLFLIDLKCLGKKNGYGVTGEIASRLLDQVGITLNKNSISGDENSNHPSGLRIGTPWITQRGLSREHIGEIAEIIDMVLKNIEPFFYEGADDEVGRGKISLKVMLEARKRTDDLISQLIGNDPQMNSGYPYYLTLPESAGRTPLFENHKKARVEFEDHFGWLMPKYSNTGELDSISFLSDMGCNGIFRLSGDGERVRAFLQQVCTGSVLLKTGESIRTYVLDGDGGVIDSVLIYRIKDTRQEFSSYLLECSAQKRVVMLEWLRGLADGYLIFDKDDIYAKVEGPVVVEDLVSDDVDDVRLSSLWVSGKGVAEVIGTGLVSEVVHHVEENIAGIDVCHIYAHPGSVGKVWEWMLKKEKGPHLLPGNVHTMEALLNNKYFSRGREVTGTQLYKSNEDQFDLGKPFFVGQKKIMENNSIVTEKKEWKWVEGPEELRRTPLYNAHLELDGRMVPFAGWEMPVQYQGMMKEHWAVRNSAGLFDVSHMGVLDFKGQYVADFIDMLTSNYAKWIVPGETQYAYLMDPDGRVIDDIFVYRKARDHYMMVVNAANAQKVWSWVNAVNSKKYVISNQNPKIEVPGGIVIRDLKATSSGEDRLIDIALQGPLSRDILLALADGPTEKNDLGKLEKGNFVETRLAGMDVMVARTGYTGEEIGFELFVHPDNVLELWNVLLERGKKFDIEATGLGARDSTRTEAGFPLYGHEIEGPLNISPMENGYAQFVKLHKPFFIGREEPRKMASGAKMNIARFMMNKANIRMLHLGDPVADRRGRCIGAVSSSVLVGEYQIGLAYIEKRYIREGAKISIFSLGGKGRAPPEKPRNQWSVGDRTIIPEEGTIITRFPCENEMSERARLATKGQ